MPEYDLTARGGGKSEYKIITEEFLPDLESRLESLYKDGWFSINALELLVNSGQITLNSLNNLNPTHYIATVCRGGL